MPIVVASPEDAARSPAAAALLYAGWLVRPVRRWEELVHALADPSTRVVLVDPALPDLNPALLDALARSLGHRPRVRVLGQELPPLVRIPATERALARLARQAEGPPGVGSEDRRELALLGLGADPVGRIGALVRSPLPLLLHGARGTGKAIVARVVHRLVAPRAPLHAVGATARWERAAGPGVVYLEAAHRRDPADLRHTVKDARSLGWTVVAASRADEPLAGMEWTALRLPSLRERPDELPALFQHYLDRHVARLGLGRRTPDKALLQRLHAWRWPENLRELEMFAIQALTRLPGPRLRAADLPPELARLLEPRDQKLSGEVAGFEEVAEERLRPVVATFAPGSGPGLHRLVVDATERALTRLVLARTAGNRKAAAELLGVARNTLLARIRELGVSAPE